MYFVLYLSMIIIYLNSLDNTKSDAEASDKESEVAFSWLDSSSDSLLTLQLCVKDSFEDCIFSWAKRHEEPYTHVPRLKKRQLDVDACDVPGQDPENWRLLVAVLHEDRDKFLGDPSSADLLICAYRQFWPSRQNPLEK